MTTQRSCTRRALTLLSGGDEPLALLPHLDVLDAQRLQLGFRFLPVSNPLRPPGLEVPLRLLELAAPRLELERHVLLECRRRLERDAPLA